MKHLYEQMCSNPESGVESERDYRRRKRWSHICHLKPLLEENGCVKIRRMNMTVIITLPHWKTADMGIPSISIVMDNLYRPDTLLFDHLHREILDLSAFDAPPRNGNSFGCDASTTSVCQGPLSINIYPERRAVQPLFDLCTTCGSELEII